MMMFHFALLKVLKILGYEHNFSGYNIATS
jgi:hypothetical protein